MFNAVTNDKISNVSYKNVFLKEEKQLSNAQFDTSLSLPFMGITSSKAQVVNTILNSSEQEKYTYLLNYLKDVPVSQNANGLKCAKQLELLLKNGKLLSRSTNDGTTTLDNLYDIATKRRAYELDSKNIISNVLNTLVDSRYVNQTFGDIPDVEKNQILQILPNDSNIKSSPNLMDVEASGTCAAASIEVNFANKYPAEFTRWVSKLSGEEKSVDINVKLTSLSPNLLEAVKILQIFQPKIKKFSWKEVVISVSTDPNAYIRAKIQDNYWDKGERSIVDVLIQSAIMQLGSQGTYDSLSDLRGGDNPQGLVEVEKTFVESVIKNKEITSLLFQQINDNQELIGYNCSFDRIEDCIRGALDKNDNVIVGYVQTNETSGKVASGYYNPMVDGAPNKVINGHEITIVDYKVNSDGKTIFICIDTDDGSDNYVEYSEDWLLPKLHHGGFSADSVKDTADIIYKNMAA